MATIGIFDSGSGGLSVFREIRKLLPDERYVYFSDNANCPYGVKTPEFILERCRAITEMMIAKGCKAIVIACNTATGAAIATLREEYPELPFIGMEPAVKPAALGTETGVIGVLATAGTLKASKYLHTRGQYEDEVRIVEHVGEGFVELVESLELSGPHAEAVVSASLLPLLEQGADRIVLGCTHYPFLIPVMEKVAAAFRKGSRGGEAGREGSSCGEDMRGCDAGREGLRGGVAMRGSDAGRTAEAALASEGSSCGGDMRGCETGRTAEATLASEGSGCGGDMREGETGRTAEATLASEGSSCGGDMREGETGRTAEAATQFIDPAPAVARQLLRTLRERGISETDPEPSVELLASGSPASLTNLFAQL